MSNRLVQLEVEEVSLVDVPAVNRKFLITKAVKTEGEPAQQEPTTKAATFNQLVTARNLDDNMWDAFYALKESIYSSLGEPNAAELVNANLTQFSAYLNGLLANTTSVSKALEQYKTEPTEPKEPVAKAGAKISRARMERLTTNLDSLKNVATDLEEMLKEVSPIEDEPEGEPASKSTAQPGNPEGQPENLEDVTKALGDLTELMKSMVTPQRLSEMVNDALSKLGM